MRAHTQTHNAPCPPGQLHQPVLPPTVHCPATLCRRAQQVSWLSKSPVRVSVNHWPVPRRRLQHCPENKLPPWGPGLGTHSNRAAPLLCHRPPTRSLGSAPALTQGELGNSHSAVPCCDCLAVSFPPRSALPLLRGREGAAWIGWTLPAPAASPPAPAPHIPHNDLFMAVAGHGDRGLPGCASALPAVTCSMRVPSQHGTGSLPAPSQKPAPTDAALMPRVLSWPSCPCPSLLHRPLVVQVLPVEPSALVSHHLRRGATKAACPGKTQALGHCLPACAIDQARTGHGLRAWMTSPLSAMQGLTPAVFKVTLSPGTRAAAALENLEHLLIPQSKTGAGEGRSCALSPVAAWSQQMLEPVVSSPTVRTCPLHYKGTLQSSHDCLPTQSSQPLPLEGPRWRRDAPMHGQNTHGGAFKP